MLTSLWRRLWFWRRRTSIARRGATVGRSVQIHDDDVFDGDLSGLSIGAKGYFSSGVKVKVAPSGRLQIGESLFVNHFAFVDCRRRITIGRDVLIGPFAYIADFDHKIDSHGVDRQETTDAPVEIGDGVWIGAGAIVLKGTTIGAGAVIGAGAIVTKPVAAGAVLVGDSARRLLRAGR